MIVAQAPWDVAAVVAPLLADPAAAKAMGERARRTAAEAGGALDRLWVALAPLLSADPRKGARRRA